LIGADHEYPHERLLGRDDLRVGALGGAVQFDADPLHAFYSALAHARLEARQAIHCFVFCIRRAVVAMAAILSGLGAVVFCVGIGENPWDPGASRSRMS